MDHRSGHHHAHRYRNRITDAPSLLTAKKPAVANGQQAFFGYIQNAHRRKLQLKFLAGGLLKRLWTAGGNTLERIVFIRFTAKRRRDRTTLHAKNRLAIRHAATKVAIFTFRINSVAEKLAFHADHPPLIAV